MAVFIKSFLLGVFIALAIFALSEAHGEPPKEPEPIHFTKNADGSITIEANDAARFMNGLAIVFRDNEIFWQIVEAQRKTIESMKCM